MIEGLKVYEDSSQRQSELRPAVELLTRIVHQIVFVPGQPQSNYESARNGVDALQQQMPEAIDIQADIQLVEVVCELRLRKPGLAIEILESIERSTITDLDNQVIYEASFVMAELELGQRDQARNGLQIWRKSCRKRRRWNAHHNH